MSSSESVHDSPLALGSERVILNRMTWSDRFREYIEQRYGERAQTRVAEALGVAKSAVSYWCRASTPRREMQKRIEKWSKGLVPAESEERKAG